MWVKPQCIAMAAIVRYDKKIYQNNLDDESHGTGWSSFVVKLISRLED